MKSHRKRLNPERTNITYSLQMLLLSLYSYGSTDFHSSDRQPTLSNTASSVSNFPQCTKTFK